MNRRRWNTSILMAAVLVTGCLAPGQAIQTDREHTQAQQALARWTTAVAAVGGAQGFVPVEDLTGQIGDWEVAVGENNKLALMSGVIEPAISLSSVTPRGAEVRWDDGTTWSAPAISAQQALADLRKGAVQPCPDCVPLKVVGARLTSTRIATSRGPATAPAWEFALDGTAVRVTRVAIASATEVVVTPPAWDPNNAPVGISIESASGRGDGRQLTVFFTGAPDPGDKPCGADYTAEAVESSTAVVVIVIEHTHGLGESCMAVGARRSALVDLAGPLGQRAALEVKQGLPVAVVLLP